MIRIALTLAAALIAGSALVTTAEAGGCGGGGGGGGRGYSKPSYSSNQASLARRQAVAQARANAVARSKARAVAAQRQYNAISVAKVETKSDPVTTAEVTPAPAPVAKKADLASTKTAEVKEEVKKDELKTASVDTPEAKQVCRKFSAAVGGLVEVPCE